MTDRVQPEETPDGSADSESRTAPHPTSIAVWGVSSPVVVNRGFVAKVGVKCSAGCSLAGRTIVVRDAAGTDVGHGRLGDAPERGTSALYAAEVALEAPAEEGVHDWTAAFVGTGPDSDPPGTGPPGDAAWPREAAPDHEATPVRDASRARKATPAPVTAPSPGPLPPSEQAPLAHAGATAAFGFRTVAPPEHRVTVTVCDRDGEERLADAEVRVGAYRGTTDADGQAQVEVQAGSYDLYVRKTGYAPYTDSVTVAGDLTLRVAAEPASDPDPDDEQVWM